MSIQEIRGMRNVNYLILHAMFKSSHRTVLGGVIIALGVCVMHYLGINMYLKMYVYVHVSICVYIYIHKI
jgi:NO-binding membrane sensor protein with MHYT domain